MRELAEKQSRLRALMDHHGLGAVWLQRTSSVAWATCGAATYVNSAATFGPVSVILTAEGGCFVVTNNIEAPRLEREEGLSAQGWQMRVAGWHEPGAAIALTSGLKLGKLGKLGSDGPAPGALDIADELARLRARLLPEEGDRLRVVARLCGQAVDSAIRAVRPGESEHEIAARLAGEAQRRGVLSVVNLVATDERAFAFRHPLPTDRKLARYAMLALAGRRHGLVCSVTRLVHFGRLREDLRRNAEASACVDAALIAATRPGRTAGQVLEAGIAAYGETGHPDEWRLHHQGGAIGYEPREYLARPGAAEPVLLGQGYAWNPTVCGTKSEDTILVGERGNDVLTHIEGWPTAAFDRPAILEL